MDIKQQALADLYESAERLIDDAFTLGKQHGPDPEYENSGVDLTQANDRGFLQSEPTKTSYGSTVQFRQSSAAMAPHIWLYTEQPEPKNAGQLPQKLGEISTHMSLEQAEEIHAKLGAHIAQTKKDWGIA